MPAAKMKMDQVSRLFSTWTAGQLQKWAQSWQNYHKAGDFYVSKCFRKAIKQNWVTIPKRRKD